MKKLTFLLTILLILGGSFGYCQTQSDGGSLSVLDILDPNATNSTLMFGRRYPQIEGSPYLLEYWSTGVIYREKGTPLEGMTLHFDIYAQELLVKQEDKVMTVVPVATKGFKLYQTDGETLLFSKKPQISEKQFFQQVYKGAYELYKAYEVNVAKRDNNSGGYGQSGNSPEIQRFTRKESWYLFRPEEVEPLGFKATKKDLLGLFPEQAAAIKNFLKDNKLKLSEDGEWAQVMAFIEEVVR